jgi:hypothetical protein
MVEFIDDLDSLVRTLEVTLGNYNESALLSVIDPNDNDYERTMDWILDMEHYGYEINYRVLYDSRDEYIDEIEITIT